MKKQQLQQIIKEEVRKALNENYRDASQNLEILLAMLAKGQKNLAMTVLEDAMDMVESGTSMEDAFDEAIEQALDTSGFRYQPINARSDNMREVGLASKQPQNELFGFGLTKLKEGDKISMTVVPKAGFAQKEGQIDEYEMEVIKTAINGVKVDFIERPETHTLVPEQGWLKSAEGKEGEKELKVGDFSRKQFGGTIKSIAVNGKETKGIKW